MSEAPERIGLISDGFGNWALAHRDEVDTDVHYIRADLYFDLEARAEKAEAERDALRDREKHFASVLSVADRGQYRNDWDAAIRRVVAERDALREALRRLLSSPAISDGDQADPEWGCSETYAAEINARAALNREPDT